MISTERISTTHWSAITSYSSLFTQNTRKSH